jgi:hypothetical protein
MTEKTIYEPLLWDMWEKSTSTLRKDKYNTGSDQNGIRRRPDNKITLALLLVLELALFSTGLAYHLDKQRIGFDSWQWRDFYVDYSVDISGVFFLRNRAAGTLLTNTIRNRLVGILLNLPNKKSSVQCILCVPCFFSPHATCKYRL